MDQTRTPDAGANSQLLTLPEASARLRTPVSTLRYWRHLGTGPDSFRLGRRVMYRQADVDRWVAARHDLEAEKRVSKIVERALPSQQQTCSGIAG